ncbi:hypothetical protein KSI01_14950 [Kurthia sibirica]|uniref:Uncharacterized protein n=1 Tax=Kurthia sibirica TaxID=202750 RepID=A0A2U3ALS4_9BACL|nr:hypothetical protein DEX24_07715 [Kurthia sibirica]GEK33962.1 hypothetical protein KSI01_14950 [Kurthia sibirica]
MNVNRAFIRLKDVNITKREKINDAITFYRALPKKTPIFRVKILLNRKDQESGFAFRETCLCSKGR